MTYARRLCGVVWYDLRVGITRNRSVYVLLCMTFVLLAIFANSALQSADVPLALSWTDYALYASRRHLSPAVRALLDFLLARFAGAPWDQAP